MEKQHSSYDLFRKLRTNEIYHSISRPIIIADNLRTPENMGSVLRLAGNIGALKTLFISEIAQDFKKYKINKTASGAAEKTNWKIITADQLCGELPDDYKLILLETTEQSDNIFNFKFPEKMALVIGNEVNGIRKEFIHKSALKLYIPIPGPISSLNATHALAIALFEWYRQMVKKS
jgi:tRNA G18 (ribose-2'-O)-methylase SpoU